MSKHMPFRWLLFCLVALTLASCGSTTDTPGSTPTDVPTSAAATAASPATSPTAAQTFTPLQVTGISITMNPTNLQPINCGAAVNIVFTAQISVAAGSGGGVLPITWNINQSAIPGTATFAAGQTSQSVTYTLSNYVVELASGSSLHGALSAGKSGSTLTSSTAVPSGHCNLPGPFQVVGISVSTNPASISNITCNTTITMTYIATVVIAPNSNAGTVTLVWNAIYRHPTATITFAPGQT